MPMLTTLSFILSHPLNKGRRFGAIARYAKWQVGSRLKVEHVHHWISGTRLIVTNGMTGATGNIYCGLHEFADMGFVLHALQVSDVFLDVGANIGSYAILASGVCRARTIAFEPDPETATHLRRNVQENELNDLVTVHEIALGHESGEVLFTRDRDTTNRVAPEGETNVRTVRIARLDSIDGAQEATIMKLDVRGYELRCSRRCPHAGVSVLARRGDSRVKILQPLLC